MIRIDCFTRDGCDACKIAIKNIEIEQPVIKYGEHIGFAIKEIKIGEHVHDHNTEGRREDLEAIE